MTNQDKSKMQNKVNQTIEILENPGAALPEEIRKWLLDGFMQFKETGKPLCRCLHLRTKGRGNHVYREKLKLRNDHLILAFELVQKTYKVNGQDKPLSHWQRLEEFSKAIKRFNKMIWRHVKNNKIPPTHLTEQEKLLFLAYKVHDDIPETMQGLAKALFFTNY